MDFCFLRLRRSIFPNRGAVFFLQITAIGGGAFGVCMPACREGKRPEILFAVAPFHFPGAGCAVFNILCMPAGREGELDEPLFLHFHHLIFAGRGAVFSGRSLHSVAVLSVYA